MLTRYHDLSTKLLGGILLKESEATTHESDCQLPHGRRNEEV